MLCVVSSECYGWHCAASSDFMHGGRLRTSASGELPRLGLKENLLRARALEIDRNSILHVTALLRRQRIGLRNHSCFRALWASLDARVRALMWQAPSEQAQPGSKTFQLVVASSSGTSFGFATRPVESPAVLQQAGPVMVSLSGEHGLL